MPKTNLTPVVHKVFDLSNLQQTGHEADSTFKIGYMLGTLLARHRVRLINP